MAYNLCGKGKTMVNLDNDVRDSVLSEALAHLRTLCLEVRTPAELINAITDAEDFLLRVDLVLKVKSDTSTTKP